MEIEKYRFSPEEIQRLKTYRDQQSNARLQKRFIALIMLAEGVSLEKIPDIIGVAHVTFRLWFKNYRQLGIDSLNSFQYKPKAPYLTKEQENELKEWVKKKPPEAEY